MSMWKIVSKRTYRKFEEVGWNRKNGEKLCQRKRLGSNSHDENAYGNTEWKFDGKIEQSQWWPVNKWRWHVSFWNCNLTHTQTFYVEDCQEVWAKKRNAYVAALVIGHKVPWTCNSIRSVQFVSSSSWNRVTLERFEKYIYTCISIYLLLYYYIIYNNINW